MEEVWGKTVVEEAKKDEKCVKPKTRSGPVSFLEISSREIAESIEIDSRKFSRTLPKPNLDSSINDKSSLDVINALKNVANLVPSYVSNLATDLISKTTKSENASDKSSTKAAKDSERTHWKRHSSTNSGISKSIVDARTK